MTCHTHGSCHVTVREGDAGNGRAWAYPQARTSCPLGPSLFDLGILGPCMGSSVGCSTLVFPLRLATPGGRKPLPSPLEVSSHCAQLCANLMPGTPHWYRIEVSFKILASRLSVNRRIYSIADPQVASVGSTWDRASPAFLC